MNVRTIPTLPVTREQIKSALNLKTKDYGYIVVADQKIILEIEDLKTGRQYAKAFGKEFYEHLPYVEYGYEDPFNFINEWWFYTIDNQELKYEVLDGKVYESLIPIGGANV